ncbi:hypothetical protein B0J17DRAFT_667627 [Rhizoctonia solani]|nr:hypothetical protein B0J17DRAFT_667627 [Rhizoctonia solani]
MLNQLTPVPLVSNDPTHYEGTTDDNDTANYLGTPGSYGTPARGPAESTKLQNLAGERSSISDRTTHNPALKDSADLCKTNELMTEIRDTLKNMSRVLIASQNSLARGLNSSAWHECGYDLGAHTLVNENGELPEVHNLPSFKQERSYMRTVVPARTLTEDALVKYLQFYNMGKEMLEEGEELKLKPGMIEDAKNLLAQYLGSRWG